MDPVLYLDLRCLQDHAYRVRGIGHHVSALLRTRAQSKLSNWKAVGLIDPRCPKLPHTYAALVDEVSGSINPYRNGGPSLFIDGTPMSHDPRFSLRFVGNPTVLTAAVVYDFIPLDWPGYLPTVHQRIDNLAKIARLRKFNYFLPISDYTAWRLSDLLGVRQEQIQVTGASVRDSFYRLRLENRDQPSAHERSQPYFLMVVGGDPRKNPEVVVRAVRHLNLLYAGGISLKIAGHYDHVIRDRLLEIAGHREGSGFLEFCPNISDEELVRLLAGAVATVIPSHIEGFSLPVVEAAVCGCPVIASSCAAHLELVEQPEALFPSHDAGTLTQRLEAVLNDQDLRTSLIASQAHLGAKFHESAVGRRFWNAIEEAVEQRRGSAAAATASEKKPRIAFLSPYPPQPTEAALYTAMTIHAGARLFHSDLYTDAPRPIEFNGRYQNAGPISIAPVLNGRYNGVISVLGNSLPHAKSFEVFERYGGPCILHDARLTQVYFQRYGQEGFLKFASELLGRSVSVEEMNAWLRDERPPSLFLERVLERASPLIVQTTAQQTLIRQRYGFNAHVATCCATMFFEQSELAEPTRRLKRDALGIMPASFVISSFGCTARSNNTDACIMAVDLLRSWNIPAELYLIGIPGSDVPAIERLAAQYGIDGHIHCIGASEENPVYRDFLIASDCALQLRAYNFGAVSTVLSNCISAGLPSVATADMAAACDAPVYVAPVPDHFSPLHLAEELANVRDSDERRSANEDVRQSYVQTHNFYHYAKRVAEILEMA